MIYNLWRKAGKIEDIVTRSSKKRRNYDARIRRLERKFSQLTAEIRKVRHELDPNRWASGTILGQSQRPKRGRKPHISPFVLRDRDDLIDMLESYWPEIAPLCAPAAPKPSTPDQLQEILELIAKSSLERHARAAHHLLEYLDVLIQYLKTNRYTGEPSQIANALAGVPEVGWWRSLRHCGARARRCMYPRGDRAVRDYLQRKRPVIYERLRLADGDVLKIAVSLKHVHSQDPTVRRLKSDANFAAQIWRVGVRDVDRLHRG